MISRKILVFGLIGVAFQITLSNTVAQGFPQDTTYSIHNAYLKIKKKYSQVQPINSFSTELVKEDRNIVYAHAGRDITLDLFSPTMISENRWPAVLLIHGGGWSSGSKANLTPLAQKLAAAGYLAVVPEYRLSSEAQYPAAIHDLKAAIRWVRSKADKYGIDPAKIAVLGCSAGAHLATFLGATGDLKKFEGKSGGPHYSTSIQAVVNIDGIVSFIHPEASAEGKSAAKWLGGSKAELPHIWKEASPLAYVGPKTPPILFINSSKPRFHAGRDDMLEMLTRHHTYTEQHTLDAAPHSFWLVHPWFEPTYELTLAFLNQLFK